MQVAAPVVRDRVQYVDKHVERVIPFEQTVVVDKPYVEAKVWTRRIPPPRPDWSFPYHDPAFGCGYRYHRGDNDQIDQRLNLVESDEFSELRNMYFRHSREEMEAKAQALYDLENYEEVEAPWPDPVSKTPLYQPATVCRAPQEDWW